MGKKKHTPTHSQMLGIVWLSAALLIIAAVAFFSSRHTPEPAQNDTTSSLHETFLTQKEDSVYRSRRTNRPKQHNTTEIQQKEPSFYTHQPPVYKKQPLVVDLNTADTLTLQLLHGIGPAYARRIVRYRERLGGFIAYSQLLEVYGFTPELLEHIRPSLTLDTGAVRHIDINSVGLKQLARHPYVEYYQARDIIRLRNLGTRFTSPDDLRAIPSMTDSTLQRLLPYITFSDSTIER